MKPNVQLSRIIAAILSTSALHAASAADTAAGPGTDGLQEIIVTATRRAENIQDVPITINALTGAELENLNVTTMADYVKYLPNVTRASFGPGQDTLYMRGLSVGLLGIQSAGASTFFPNVAAYLDEQSTVLPGRNLDVYAVDLARIEVLEGPQGTLFGAGAQAGAIRYITNTPQLNTFSVALNGGYGSTEHGDPNSNVNATLNIPLIKDTLAARLVVYNDERGGYIDNLPSTFTRQSSDLGLSVANGGVVPTNSAVINNYQLATKNINPVTYKGLRAELLGQINDDWNVLLQQSFQNMDAQGVFYEQPYASDGPRTTPASQPYGGAALPALSVNLFSPSFNKDRFEDTALTVHGKAGPLSLIYAGSYLTRNVETQQDYTNYSRGRFAYYYQCVGVSYSALTGNANAQCQSPAASWHDSQRNTHVSHEFRVSTPDDWRVRGLAGVYYEELKIYTTTDWMYKTVPQCSAGGLTSSCFLPIGPPSGQTAINPNLRNSETNFFNDYTRGFRQTAAFASLSVDIVPKVLTITGGIRHFDMRTSLLGGTQGSFFCKQFAPTTYFGRCLNPIPNVNMDASTPNHQREIGNLGRADIAWHITPDILAYYTYSQGFRPGGFNHGSSLQLPDAAGDPRFQTPAYYQSDLVTNNEIGWKTEWFDHQLLFNGALYQERWNNVQTYVFCPQCGLGTVPYISNGPRYKVRGVEIQIAAHPIKGLTVQGSASWNSSNLENSPALLGNIPGSSAFRQPITTQYTGGVTLPIANVYGATGSPLANSPPMQASVQVRYEHPVVGDYVPFVQAGAQHQAHSLSGTGYVLQFEQPSWTTYDASFGVSKDNWTASLNAVNLTDVNKSLYSTGVQSILAETPIRPRTITLNVSYRFSEPR